MYPDQIKSGRDRKTHLTPEQRAKIGRYRLDGRTYRDIANRMGIAETTVWYIVNKAKKTWPDRPLEHLAAVDSHLRAHTVPPEAKRALDDVVYFARRYFGLLLHPWQEEAAWTVVKLLETPDEEFLVVNAPPGSGKPVHVDALVLMGDGSRKRLGDIEVGDWVIGGSGLPREVTAVHEQGELPLVRLTDDRGRSLLAAPDHMIATPDEPSGFVYAKDMEGLRAVNVTQPTIPVGSYRRPEEFRLAGYFTGDGCTTQCNQNVVNADPGVIADVYTCVKALGWKISRDEMKNGARHMHVSTNARKGGPGSRGAGSVTYWLRDAGLHDKTSWYKRVPGWVFTAPPRLIAEYIGAYFACDGTVGPDGRGVEFYSVSRPLLADVQHLLLRLGIQSNLKQKIGSYFGRRHYSWRLSIIERSTFARLIPVAGVKNERLANCRGDGTTRATQGVVTVQEAGQGECRCLTVDTDGTFTADDFLVHNSTWWTFVVPAWLTCRDRNIRGLIVSAAQTTAELYLKRLRTAFTTTTPFRSKPKEVEAGRAVDAQACLCIDYGPFRPEDRRITWSADALSVIPPPGMPRVEKENTWQAFGRSRTFLGARVDFIIADDVYDPEQLKSAEAKEGLRNWWDTHIESRLEPAGLLVLQGQRFGPDDLYAHCLSKADDTLDDDDEPLEETEPDTEPDTEPVIAADGLPAKTGKYRHAKYQAHYTDKCEKIHNKAIAKPYPNGCLLAPNRLSWRRLAAIARDDPKTFAVVYQQDDTPKGHVLVHPLWVQGGQDPETKERFVGCWDLDRDEWQLPQGLRGPLFFAASVDPSATRWWSCQLYCYDANTTFRYLLAHHRAKMTAPDFLDWDEITGNWTGLMDDWQNRAEKLGWPLRHWIVEQNAAAKYLLQYQHVHRWAARHSVSIIGHETQTNKTDPQLGVGTIGPNYRHGRVRLPGMAGSEGRRNAELLVAELTKWPEGRTDDCVMASWFFEYNLPRLHRPDTGPIVLQRPSWLSSMPDPRKALAS